MKSSISNTVSAFISIGNPASTSAKASAVNANQIKITWKKATRATNYEIYRSTSKTKGFVKIATTGNTRIRMPHHHLSLKKPITIR